MTGSGSGAVFSALFGSIAVQGVLWVVAYWPSLWLHGRVGVLWMTGALLLCGVPGLINTGLALVGVAAEPLVRIWLHMAVRVGVVFAGVLIVRSGWPQVGISLFYGWVMGFYLITMGFEVWTYQKALRSGARGE